MTILDVRHQNRILLSFVLIAAPFYFGALAYPELFQRLKLDSLYFIFFANLHFTVTLGFFFEKGRGQAQLTKERLFFFYVPALFAFFWLIGAFDFDFTKSLRALSFTALKVVNAWHFGRQSYGVLQLFKQRDGSPRALSARKLESGAFHLLEAALICRVIDPSFALRFHAVVTGFWLAILVISFLVLKEILASRHSNKLKTAAYYSAQAFAFILAIYQPSLFVYAIAVHYFEYLLLVGVRFFDPSSHLSAGGLKGVLKSRVLFYLIAINISVCLTLSFQLDRSHGATFLRYGLSIFDGIFAVHFLLESFAWKRGYA